MQVSGLQQTLRKGAVVLVLLAVLTAIEFAVAVWLDPGRFAILGVIAIAKTWLVVDYFMHIRKSWNAEDH
ncbi:MAG: cytochrome C oxidase subunit IV family protein [SAR202 cluster bacterium]|jgi:caa(3)-type oxidase subunit IV|nr:cytochrome C oxidase subunit IV family protein [SAR202 cluster bacterium]